MFEWIKWNRTIGGWNASDIFDVFLSNEFAFVQIEGKEMTAEKNAVFVYCSRICVKVMRDSRAAYIQIFRPGGWWQVPPALFIFNLVFLGFHCNFAATPPRLYVKVQPVFFSCLFLLHMRSR